MAATMRQITQCLDIPNAASAGRGHGTGWLAVARTGDRTLSQFARLWRGVKILARVDQNSKNR